MYRTQLKYPIGQQDFKSLREEGCIYVDKTHFIDKIISRGSRYNFLARPRRFGKSLFLSTLRYFFEGKRELFKDLYIDSADWDWQPYPVLYLDLNVERYADEGAFESVIDNILRRWEAEYGVDYCAAGMSSRFSNIISAAHEKTFNMWCPQDSLAGIDLLNPTPAALMYQTGYLTIKDYDGRLDEYLLGIPNNEVKRGLYNALLPYYVKSRHDQDKGV